LDTPCLAALLLMYLDRKRWLHLWRLPSITVITSFLLLRLGMEAGFQHGLADGSLLMIGREITLGVSVSSPDDSGWYCCIATEERRTAKETQDSASLVRTESLDSA
jgi:hypothetical protein